MFKILLFVTIVFSGLTVCFGQNGVGSGCGGLGCPRQVVPPGPKVDVSIVSKPRPARTEAAREANIQGTVILRVTFLANGKIGHIMDAKGLPFGLSEQAILAARRIVFKPATANGVPYTVTKMVEYTFTSAD